MKKRVYELLKLVVCLLFFFFIGDIITFFLKLFGININNLSNNGVVIYQFGVSLIMVIYIFIIYYKNIKKDFRRFKNNNTLTYEMKVSTSREKIKKEEILKVKSSIKKNIAYIIKTFFIFMVVKYIVSFISVLIMVLLGFNTSSMTSVNQNLIQTYLKTSPILMFFTTAIFAPFYEEVLFRLGFRKVIKNKYLFIIISGVVFGILHVFPLEDGVDILLGISQSISYVTMGIFLSYIYAKTDNIFMSIGIHFLNNFLSVLVMLNMF